MSDKDQDNDSLDIWDKVNVSGRALDYALPVATAIVGAKLATRGKWKKGLKGASLKGVSGAGGGTLGYLGGSAANYAATGRDTLPGLRRRKK